eukprot:scaffold23488_cov21-Tisochrysis_lutea.AAC.1
MMCVQHGEHYFFTTKEQFAKEIAEDKFIEYAEVHGNLYGTSVAAVRKVLESGRTCILDIDVQGARLVRKTPLKVSVFCQLEVVQPNTLKHPQELPGSH